MLLSVAYIGRNSRKKRPSKTKIGVEIAYITCDSDTTFKMCQGHQAALLSTALTHKAAVAVSVGTYSAWESTATLRQSARRCARRYGAHGGGEGQGILCRHAHSLLETSSYLALKSLDVSLSGLRFLLNLANDPSVTFAPKMWNSLPLEIRLSLTLETFKCCLEN